MSEPLRTETDDHRPSPGGDREALIEQLLVSGLDAYFAGHYEQAVNVWTRVAFIERGHGRARAYIERARSALAERQRRSEELLHRGIAAYDGGDLQAARELLDAAVAEGGATETALVFLQRLGRVAPLPEARTEAAHDARPRRAAARGGTGAGRASAAGAASPWLRTTVACVAVAAAVLVTGQGVTSWLAERPMVAPAPAPVPVQPLPIVRTADVQLARARELYAAGRLHDALRVLERIDPADRLRPEAQQVAADVQRDLLALAAARAPEGTR